MAEAGAERLSYVGHGEPSPSGAKGVFLAPYKFRPAMEIPRREFLYGTHYARGFISTTVAPGGVGKSALAIVEALAMATGRPLLGIKPNGKFRIGYWNGEDPLEETERRIAAAIIHFGLDGDDLQKWLFWGSGREHGLTIAEQGRDGATVSVPDFERVKAAASHLDALIIDPFVSSHRVPENDNGAIDLVAKTYAQIAAETNVAVELNHHTRKAAGPAHEVTVEDGRGAVALLAAARSGRVLNVMTEDQATQAGVDRRRSYFRVENGKANLAPPPDGSTWYQFVSVDLGNGPDGSGDSVGVVTPWTWPDPFDDVSAGDAERVQRAVDGGNWRENVQARDWVGNAVADALSLDMGPSDKANQRPEHKRGRAKVRGLIKTWLASSVLAIETRPDQHREPRPFVVVGKWVVP